MSSLPSNDRTAGARRWPAISGGIGVALVAVLIGWQMPSALHRSGHASNVASLKSEIASTQRESDTVEGLVGQAQVGLEDGRAENDDLARQVGQQEEDIAALQETVASLKRDIAALGG